MIKISLVPPELIPTYWDEALKHLEKAFEYSSLKVKPENVLEDCLSGNLTLWVVFEGTPINTIGAFTIRIKKFPAGLTLAGEHLGGERLNEWADDMFSIMEKYAKDYGATSMELIGRRGWEKILKPKGWKADLVIFEKEIRDE